MEETPLPLYQCHKRVRAGKIKKIGVSEGKVVSLVLEVDGEEIERQIDEAWFSKHDPQIGGYLVEYEDGYRSFSPAEAFEGGYTRVP